VPLRHYGLRTTSRRLIAISLQQLPVAGKNDKILDLREYLQSVQHAALERAQPVDGIF
jgi:hypothetical protein